MRVRVAEIPDEGLRIEGPDAFDRPFQDPAWSARRRSAPRWKRTATRSSSAASLEASVPQLCGRCLGRFDVTVTPEIDTRFVPSPRGRGEEHELGGRRPRDRRLRQRHPRPERPARDGDNPRPAHEAALCRDDAGASARSAGGTAIRPPARARSTPPIPAGRRSRPGRPASRDRHDTQRPPRPETDRKRARLCPCRRDATRRPAAASAAPTTRWSRRHDPSARSAARSSLLTASARTAASTRGAKSSRSRERRSPVEFSGWP